MVDHVNSTVITKVDDGFSKNNLVSKFVHAEFIFLSWEFVMSKYQTN